jgi:hypothetical protein
MPVSTAIHKHATENRAAEQGVGTFAMQPAVAEIARHMGEITVWSAVGIGKCQKSWPTRIAILIAFASPVSEFVG